MGPSAMRNPRPTFGFRLGEDRRASTLSAAGGRRSTITAAQNQRPSGPVRHSITFGGGSRGIRQDPRPLTDRSYIHQSVKTLITFLVDHGYDSQVSVKTLTNPSSKDFVSVFLFLMQRIDPTFDFQKRFEEELPVLLKCLGYPFTISRSALSAVGSPHTWPTLLGVLMYLVGLITYDEACIRKEESMELDHRARREEFFRENTTKAYSQWLHGAEAFPELDKEHENFFTAESEGREDQISKLQADVEQLTSTEQSLRTQPSPLNLCKEHLTSLDSNVNKFKLLLPSLTDHLAGIQKKVLEREDEIKRLKADLDALKNKRANLEPILARQEDEAIDAERIFRDREKLQTGLNRAHSEREQVENDQRVSERRVADKHQRLNLVVSEYHRDLEAYDVKGREAEFQNWHSKDELNISIATDATVTDAKDMLSRDIENEVLPKIEDMKEFFSRVMPSLREGILNLHEEVDETEERMMMLRHEVSVLKGQNEQREAEYDRKKMDLQECLAERSRQILRSEEERNVSLKEVEMDVHEADRRVSELVAFKKSLEKQFERDRLHMSEMLSNDIRNVKHHHEVIRALTLEVKAHLVEKIDALNSLPT